MKSGIVPVSESITRQFSSLYCFMPVLYWEYVNNVMKENDQMFSCNSKGRIHPAYRDTKKNKQKAINNQQIQHNINLLNFSRLNKTNMIVQKLAK